MIEAIYYKAGSSSWPKKWISGLSGLYEVASVKEFERSEVIKELTDYCRVLIYEAVQELEQARSLALSTAGLEKYAITLTDDLKLFEGLDEAEDYSSLQALVKKIAFGRIAIIKKFDGDAKLKDRIKTMRDEAKKKVDGIQKKYFGMSIELMYEQLVRQKPFIDELIRLSLEFYEVMD